MGIKTYITGLLVAGALSGCKMDSGTKTTYFKDQRINGKAYDISLYQDNVIKVNTIRIGKLDSDKEFDASELMVVTDNRQDYRADEISLQHMNKGDPRESIVSIDSLGALEHRLVEMANGGKQDSTGL